MKKIETKESCDTCKFYREHVCKRYPPVRGHSATDRFQEKWVFMDRHEWCGEYLNVN